MAKQQANCHGKLGPSRGIFCSIRFWFKLVQLPKAPTQSFNTIDRSRWVDEGRNSTSLRAHQISYSKVGWLAANDIKVGGYTMTAIDGWMGRSTINVSTRLWMEAATFALAAKAVR